MLGSWNKFQPINLIGKLDLSLLVNTLAQATDETCSTASASLDLVKKRRNQLVPLEKTPLQTYHFMVQKHGGLLSALLLPLDHLVHVSSSSSTAKAEGSSTGP